MRIEYSPDVDALYVQLGAGEVAETIEIGPDAYADIDEVGNPIGVEFLDAPDFFRFLARHRNPEEEGVTVVDLPEGLIELVRREATIAVG